MSTAPSGFQTPKTNWQPVDVVQASDLNRIEGNINAIEQGARTLDQAQAPSGNEGSLRQILSWLANRIRAITGKTNWYDAPDVTLATLVHHKDRHASGGADALTPADIGAAPASHVGSGGSAHALATMSEAGFMSPEDKTNLNNLLGSNHGYFVELASGVLYYHADEFSGMGNENGYGNLVLRITLPFIPAYAVYYRWVYPSNVFEDDFLSIMGLTKRLSVTKLTWTARSSASVTVRVTYQWDNGSEVVFSTRNLTNTFQTFTENLNLSESNFTNRRLTIRIYIYGVSGSSATRLKDIKLEGTIIGKVVR